MAVLRWKGLLLPALLLPVLLAGSCGLLRPSGRLLVLTDPATQVLLEHGGLDGKALERLAARHGLALQALSAPAPGEAEPLLRGVARQVQPKQVLLLTPFPVDVAGLAAEFPRTVFIRLSSAAAEEVLPPNWIGVRFDRAGAFRRAGELVGRLLAGGLPERGLPTGGGEGAEGGTGPLKAAVLLGEAGTRSLSDAAAFREGFAAARDPSLLVERNLPAREGGGAPDDPRGLRQVLEELHRDGVRVFLLKAYAANPDALEAVAALGAAAVVEDWLASRARPEAVLLSIETDLHETLERALAAAADRTAAPGPASGTPDPGRGVLIEGPVRLVRGGALPGKALPVGDGARR